MDTLLDTTHNYHTAEGVQLSLNLAGPMVRGMAWCIDFAIRALCYIILTIVLTFFGGIGTSLILIGLFLIEWFYPVFFEVRNGMTPGKKAMGIQVVNDDGTPISWSPSLIRNLLRSVDLLPFFNMTGFIAMLLNPQFKRLGDLAAGTVVVHFKEKKTVFSIPEYYSRPAPRPLKLFEQRLILIFCERASNLSEQRRRELAKLLTELTDDDIPENSLLAYGNWFLKGSNNHESKHV